MIQTDSKPGPVSFAHMWSTRAQTLKFKERVEQMKREQTLQGQERSKLA